jgi:NAD(P)H dehydrogenase (quinone)
MAAIVSTSSICASAAVAHLKQGALSADVVAEQARIDWADALVLVYSVYWWSMPGLLKGCIDRVFSNGWAYDENPGGKLVKKLDHFPVHLVAVGGADEGTYAKHGIWVP